MQPLNNCLVLLTGSEGKYDHRNLIPMTPYDYKVIFPIPLDNRLTDARNDLLLKLFSLDVPESYQILSGLPRACTAHKDNIPAQSQQHCQSFHDHYLKTSMDSNPTLSLEEIAPEKFKSYPLYSSESWSDSLEVILDQGQILRDLNRMINNEGFEYNGKNFQIGLSSETCIQMRMKEKDLFSETEISLTKFLDSIIPNVRIPFIYHKDSQTIEVTPSLYLNDGVSLNPETVCEYFGSMLQKATDFYYEAIIPSNAFVIWDSSRQQMNFRPDGSRSSCQIF